MSPVFSHGRLRLYLLHLLHEQPRHGYELIRLLEDRFLGTYAPSAGTIYPRLARLEAEGLVTHDIDAGRKVFRLTEAGERELADRAEELDDVEDDISQSVRDRARDVREDVHRSARDLREELRGAARELRREARHNAREGWPDDRAGVTEDWRDAVRETWKRAARDVWKDATTFDRQSEPAASAIRALDGGLARLATEIRKAAERSPIERDAVEAAAQVLDDALERLRRALRPDVDEGKDPASGSG
jgi:DNA-binding PadR family transcriptional regulator